MTTTKLLAGASGALMIAAAFVALPTPPAAQAQDTWTDVQRAQVINLSQETWDQPLKRVTNSDTAIKRLNATIDNWTNVRTKFKVGSTENLFKFGTAPQMDANGLYEIDCSSFVQANLESIVYGTSRYNPTVKDNYQNFSTTGWTSFTKAMPFQNYTKSGLINRRMLAADLAQWSHDHGYWFVTRPKYENLRVGDVVFWHAYGATDANGNPIWKQVSHAAFVTKILPDGYFELADATGVTLSTPNLMGRRTMHAADLARLQVYSAARFPLDQMWTWDQSASQINITKGWTWNSSVGGYTYVGPDGTMAKSTWKKIATTLGDRYFYFDATGKALYGKQYIGGTYRYIDQLWGDVSYTAWNNIITAEDNVFGTGSEKYYHYTAASRGWQFLDGYWQYFLPATGYMARDGWQWTTDAQGWGGQPNDAWNYCRHDGKCVDLLKTENGRTYMTLAGPRDYARGWYTTGGYTRYFLNTEYAPMATGMQKIDGYWYLLHPTTGTKQFGWQSYGGYWRYLNPSTGVMQLAGTVKINNVWKSFNWTSSAGYYAQKKIITAPDGYNYMVLPGPVGYGTSYQYWGGKYYYFFPTNGHMAFGWQYTDGTWHYYRGDGSSVIGGATIDGKYYYFQSYKVGVSTR